MGELEKEFEEFLGWAEVNDLIKLYKYKEMAKMLAEIVNKYERLFVLKILELEKENEELKKQLVKYKEEVIEVIEGSALDIEFKSDNQELVNRINKINVKTK